MKNIEFRRYDEQDLNFIHELLSDEATKKYFPFMYTSDISQSELRLKSRLADDWFLLSKDDFHTLVILNEEKEPVGEISYHSVKDNYRTLELVIIIHPKHRGQGYAKAATSKYIEKIREKIRDVDRIRLLIEETNKSSRAVAQSLEFELKGRAGIKKTLEKWEREI